MTPPADALQPRFRLATRQDVAAVRALVESAYRGEASRAGWTTEADLLDGQRTDEEALDALLATPGSVMVLAESDEDGLVGCCALEARPDATAYLGLFAVRPTRQGSGIGSTILAEAERIAFEEWGAPILEMTVIGLRADLLAWYARRGYEPTGRTASFPYGDERSGIPRRPDLEFVVLAKSAG